MVTDNTGVVAWIDGTAFGAVADMTTIEGAGTTASPFKVKDLGIITAKLADNAVTTIKIADANVTTAKIADSNVTTSKIADANVTNAKLATDAVTTAKILDGTILVDDLANNAVETAKIKDLNVTTTKLADAAVTTTKIASGGNNKVLVTDNTGVVAWIDGTAFGAVADMTTIEGAGTTASPFKVKDLGIITAKLADNAVTTIKIADANVTTAKIADSNVTTSKIADANVTNAKLATDAVTTGKILDGTILVDDLANNAVETAKIKDLNVTTTKLADAAVTTTKIASGGNNKVLVTDSTGVVAWIDGTAFGAVADMTTIEGAGTTASPFKVKDLGIITAKLADNAVTTIKIADANVTTAKIADSNVTTSKIADANVTNAKLATDAVTTGKILDGTILVDDLANNAVETAKIKDLNVTTTKLADAAVTTTKIASGGNNKVLVTDNTGVVAWIDGTAFGAVADMTTIEGAGTTASPFKVKDLGIITAKLADNAVTTIKIADANVTTAKIADSNITTSKIADANVTTSKLADSNVTTSKIADLNVTTDKIADEAVTSTKILNGTILNDDIADNTITTDKISGQIAVSEGGTGSDMSTTIGYVKQANIGDNFTTVTSIPVADVTGAVRKVNGVSPNTNGEVTINWGTVYSGTLANISTGVPNPANGDTYVIANDSSTNNGRTFIYDGTNWLEVTPNQAALDARYLRLSGDTMQGDIVIPANNKITLTDLPTNATDAANKAYVDTQITNATPDASTSVKGKIQLGGDLAGTGTTAAAPVISNNAITTSKLADLNVTTTKLADAAVTTTKIASGGNNKVLVTDNTGVVAWIDGTAFGAVADMTTIEGAGTTASPFKVKDLGIITAKLADNAVTTIKIADANVTTAKIADSNVTTSKIADANVTNTKLATDAVTTAKILDGTILVDDLANNAVETAKIKDLNVTTTKLADAAVTTTKIASGGNNKVLVTDNTGVVAWINGTAFGAVADMTTIEGAGTTASPFKVKDLGIITAKLADNAVTTIKIADANVTTAKIADSNITTSKIADANVTNAKLATDAVTTAKILDGTILVDDLANNAVETAKIKDLNVTTTKLADAAVTTTKIASGGNNKVLVTDNTGVVAWIDGTAFGAVADMTTIEGAGTTASPFKVKDLGIITAKLADNAVTTIKIADANVTTAKIADSNVTTSKIADANVTNAKLATDAVTTGKILDGTILVDDLANNAVETAKIKDLNVTTTKLADAAVTTTKIASGGNNKVLVTDNTGVVAWIDGTAFGAVADMTTIEGAGTTASPFKVKDLGIITAKLADNAVTTIKIADANVTTAKIADSNVTTSKIADANVTNAKLATDAVTTAKILDGTILVDDLANNAVETAKIKDLNVTTTKLADAAVTTTKIASGGNSKVLVTDNTGVVAWIDGTAFGAVADMTTIEGAGTTASPFKVKDLGIITAKLADNAVTTIKIADANVTTAKLADASISTAKVIDGNITTSKLANAAVTTTKIASGGNSKVLVTDNTGVVAWIDGTAFGAVADMTTIEGAGTTASPFKVKDLGIITAKLADNAVTTIKIADANVTNAKLATDAVTTGKILDGTILVDDLANNAVETAKIKDLNVTTTKLADAAVTTTKIASGGNNKVLVTDNTGVVAWIDGTAFGAVADMTTIEGAGTTASPFKVKDLGIITAKLADNAVTTIKIADANVTTTKIADSNITTSKIADANVTNAKLATDAVTTGKILDGTILVDDLANNAVETAKIKDLNVTTTKLADAAVTTTKIASGGNNKVLVTDNTGVVAWIDGTAFGAVADMTTIEGAGTTASPFKVKDLGIITAKLADNAVTTIKIADANVTTAKIADSNITTSKIADANVTNAKLATDAVTTSKLADANVTTAKLADASVTTAKIASGGNSKVLVTDNTGVVAWIDGTAFGAVADMTSIEGAGTTASPFKVKDLGIITEKLANGAVTSPKILDGTIIVDDLSNDAVETSKIKDLNVTTSKLANNAVTTGKIEDGTILNEDIADNTITTSKIAGQIAVADGGTGSNMSTTTGYVKQATSGANFTTVTSIPVADVAGAVRKVNGSLPDSNGNVMVDFGTVSTGILANIPLVTTPGLTNGDIYVVSSDSNPLNNGLTYIFDGSQWQEVTPNQAALDARYLRLAGGTMQGDIVIPATKKITLTDAPNTATDAVNKAYVDAQIASGAPDATTSLKGKIQLGGDLAGTGTTAAAPIISDNAITNNKINSDAVTTDKILNGTIIGADLADAIITNAKLAEIITVPNGGTGATSLTGYVKGNGTNAMTTVATLPVADIVGAQTTANLASDISANTGATTLYPSVAAVEAFVANSATPDATTSSKGKIKLAGDLAGTADLPTVPGLATKAPIASPSFTGVPLAPTATTGTNTTQIATTEFVTTAVAAATISDASTTIKGKIQLAGDLGGSNDAANPTISLGAVTTTKLADNAVTTVKITDANVTSAKIANDAITNAKLADNAVQTENIVDGNITTAKLAAVSVTPSKIEPGTNNTVLVTDNTGAVSWIDRSTFGAVADQTTIEGAGTTTNSFKVKDGAITTIKLADNAVTNAKIIDDAVTSSKITAAAVTTVKLADNAVTTVKITDANVTSAKIANDAITNAKLADNAVQTENIVDGNITTAKLASVSVTPAKIEPGTNNTVLVTDNAGAVSWIDRSTFGAVADQTTIEGAGTTLSQFKVKDGGVSTAKLADNAVTNAKITDEAITTAKLASNAVTTIKLADNSIITSKLADDAVTNAKIGEIVSVENGGTGANMTTSLGYVKQATAGANFTTTSTIPVADVTGAVRKVNGSIPDANGNVAVTFGTVFTGTLANRPTVVSSPNNGDIYVVSSDSNALNNGITYIYDGSAWQEVTANQASLDARYLKLAGGTMQGDLAIPTGKDLTIADAPTNATDAVNKAYVDSQITANTTPDATSSLKGKIKLAGDLGGTADLPTVPGLATKEPTIAAGTTSQYWRGDKTWQTLDKSAVGLSNVDNTSDANKPISTATQTALNLKAPLVSPALTGSPTAPTASTGTNTTQIATTEFVTTAVSAATIADATASVKGKLKLAGDLGGTADLPTVPGLATKAPLASPALTGSPTAPTATAGTNTTQIATTEFVTTAVSAATIADATASVKGKLKLAGDLGGTADSPTVPELVTKAPLASPALTGTPTAPTAAAGTNTTQIATTAFVAAASGTPFYKTGTTTDVLSDKTVNFFTNNRLGIGTNNPINNLDVVGGFNLRSTAGANGTGYGMEFNTSSNAPRIDWVFNGAYIGQFSSDANDFILKNSKQGSGGFAFYTNVSGTGTEKVRISNSGNLGIGTSSPAYSLDVLGSARIQSVPNTSVATGVLVKHPTTGQISEQLISDIKNTAWYTTGTTTDAGGDKTGNIYRTGRIGIGISPLSNLHVYAAANTTMPTTAATTASTIPLIKLQTTNTALGMFTANAAPWTFGWQSYENSTGIAVPMALQPVSGNVGIGTIDPTASMEISRSSGLFTGTETSGHGLQIVSGKTNGTDYSLYMGADKTNGLSYLQSVRWGTSVAPLVLNGRGGKVSVGSAVNPTAFEVNGAATNTTAFNAAAGTSIDFSKSNLAYTTASAGAFTLTNIKDGGTYTLSVQGATSGTASFTATGFTFRQINNGATSAGKHTLYTFLVMGTTVYVYMATGF